jgi:hypothetical protein
MTISGSSWIYPLILTVALAAASSHLTAAGAFAPNALPRKSRAADPVRPISSLRYTQNDEEFASLRAELRKATSRKEALAKELAELKTLERQMGIDGGSNDAQDVPQVSKQRRTKPKVEVQNIGVAAVSGELSKQARDFDEYEERARIGEAARPKTEEEKRQARHKEMLDQIDQADAMDARLARKNEAARRRAKGLE